MIPVLGTLSLLDNAARAAQDGLVRTVTPVLTDGFLRPVIRSVMDSAAVTMVNVRVVSRMGDGKEHCGVGLPEFF